MQARSLLVAAGIPAEDASLDAEVLARHALGWDRAALLAHGREPAPPDFGSKFDPLIARRVRREPVAQIVGTREFWGMDFEVTPDVLIPRPETELIVEQALAFARDRACRTVIDVGTGTGCIAIAIAREMPKVRVVATDRSAAALEVARRNADRLGVGQRVSFRCADLLAGVDEMGDLIVSNPPYVPEVDAAALQPEVARFEPRAALFGGQDGLGVIRRLLHEAHTRLADNGRLIIEFGVGQERALRNAATDAGWSVTAVRCDLQGIPRTAILARERSDV